MHEAYPNDLRIVYKQLPLRNHFWAQIAAEAAMAAGAQGKFFEFDDMVFSRQRELTPMLTAKAQEMGKADQWRDADVQQAVFVDLCGELGLDTDRVRQELESGAWKSRVGAEALQAAKIGVSGTPGSFVNGRYLRGAQPYARFKAEIDKEIAWARNGDRPDFAKGTSIAQLSRATAGRRGPDPNKAYPLQAGAAPFEGPAGAKVTLLHYLDYQ